MVAVANHGEKLTNVVMTSTSYHNLKSAQAKSMDVTIPKCATVPLPQSTPIKIDSSTTCPFTTNQKYCIPSCTVMAEEMAKFIVGPMPARDFLDQFFPTRKIWGLSQVPLFKPGCYNDTLDAKCEIDVYRPFMSKLVFISFNIIPILFKV